MSVWQAVKYCIVQKYASGQGRAGRGEFFSYFFCYILFCIFWGLFILTSMAHFGDINLVDFVLMYIPFLFLPPLVAVIVRRLHDTGKNGWLALLLLIPFINIFGFGLLCMKGMPGANRFGAPPEHVDF